MEPAHDPLTPQANQAMKAWTSYRSRYLCRMSCLCGKLQEWNTGGHSAPLPDHDPYGTDPNGVWFNRIHTFEAGKGTDSRTVHFPRSCLHREDAACVSVCPTGASYKRDEDGIVLVNEDACIGCKLCSWACPYGAANMTQTQVL